MTPDVEPSGGATHAAEGRRWLAALPTELGRQRVLLHRLLDLAEATPSARSLSVGCSIGRGAADALSDVDAALGVDAPRGQPGADRVLGGEAAVVAGIGAHGSVVDLLRDRIGPPDRFIRRVFVQFDDGVQLDLAIMAESEVRRGRAAPDFVTLYRSSAPARARAETGSPPTAIFPAAESVTPDEIFGWTFLGWCALADLAKYLHRRSPWEAHQRLHEARGHIWALWAAAHSAIYPRHGLSQVLDQDPPLLPADIEHTVAGLDPDDLRRAARAAARILGRVSELAAARHAARLPTGMAGYVQARLEIDDERT